MNSLDKVNITNRIVYLDISKGIGIVLMVMGHSAFGNVFSHYIHAFHMPLFFFVSGYLYCLHQNQRWEEYMLKKSRSILIPYAVFGLGIYFIWILVQFITFNGQDQNIDLLAPLGHLLWINSTGLVVSGEFWFLSAFFFASIFFDAIFRLVSENYARAIIIILFAILGCLFRRIFDVQLPWSLLSAMVGMGIMGIAYCIKGSAATKPFFSRLLRMNWFEITILLFIIGGLIFLNGPVNMRRSVYSNIFLFWTNAIIMSLIVINISRKLEHSQSNSIFSKMQTYLAAVGRDSITYLCLNSLILTFLAVIYAKIFGTSITIFRATVLFVLTMYLIWNLNKLLMRSPLCFLLGRSNKKRKTE